MSLGWDTSFHLNGKFPLLDNTIFNTVDSALNFIRDVNSSAIAGTIIGVTDSSNISSSGIYEIFNDNGKLALRKLATLELLRESVSNVLDLITNQSGNYDAKLAELAALQTLQLEALRNEIFSPDGETASVTRTMMLQVGSDSTNYRFSTSEIGEKDTDGVINNNGILQFLRGTLFHFSITLENSSLAKLWNVSNEYIIEDVDRNQTNLIEFFNLKSIPLGESLWIYFLASKNGTNAKWYISPIKYAWNEVGVPGLVNGNSDYYYLLYGYCGYTKLKNAFFEPLYGNTWIKGSTIYTGKVLSMDGVSVMDLDNNTFNLGNEFNYANGLVVIGDVNKSAFVLNKDSESGELLMHFGKKIDSKWEGMTFADGKLIIGKYDDQIKNLQSQIDNDIQTWFGKGYPIPYLTNTGDNYITEGKDPIITLSPEGEFTMEGLSPEVSIDGNPNHHLGDIFINLIDSSSWRFIIDENNQYKWQFISDEALSSVYKVLGDLDRQIDNKITTWVLSNDPLVDWKDDPKEEETWETGKDYKKYHIGDLWYNTDTKEAKQYTLSEEEYTWIKYDGGTSIFDFIDGKRTIYNNYDAVSKDGYHIGDWWCLENNSDEIESILDNSYTDAAGNPIYLQGLLLVAIKDKNVEFNWDDWEILLLNPKEVQNEVTKIKNDLDTIKTALDIVLDGQTTIGDSFVQTMMLRIGADSTNYILLKTSTSGNRMTNLYWDGNFLKVLNPDIMIHSSYTWKSATSNGNKWNISKSEFECEVSEENSVDPIYIYIEASRDSNKAFWKYALEPQPLFFTDENGQGDFYNFPFATIVDQSTKTLIEVRGNTKIIGDRIITGKLESNTGNSYFDLDNGTFVLGKSNISGLIGAFSYDGNTVYIGGVGSTNISGGLVLTNTIGVLNSSQIVTAGLCGNNNSDNIAFWAGAPTDYKEDAPVKITFSGIGSKIGPLSVEDTDSVVIDGEGPDLTFINNKSQIIKKKLQLSGKYLESLQEESLANSTETYKLPLSNISLNSKILKNPSSNLNSFTLYNQSIKIENKSPIECYNNTFSGTINPSTFNNIKITFPKSSFDHNWTGTISLHYGLKLILSNGGSNLVIIDYKECHLGYNCNDSDSNAQFIIPLSLEDKKNFNIDNSILKQGTITVLLVFNIIKLVRTYGALEWTYNTPNSLYNKLKIETVIPNIQEGMLSITRLSTVKTEYKNAGLISEIGMNGFKFKYGNTFFNARITNYLKFTGSGLEANQVWGNQLIINLSGLPTIQSTELPEGTLIVKDNVLYMVGNTNKNPVTVELSYDEFEPHLPVTSVIPG